MKLLENEIKLILSCLENDNRGSWADSRGDDIAKLIKKIKSETAFKETDYLDPALNCECGYQH